MQNHKSLTLCWRSFSRGSSDVDIRIFVLKCGQYFDYVSQRPCLVLNYQTHKTKNCWGIVDAHYQDGSTSVSQSILLIKTTNPITLCWLGIWPGGFPSVLCRRARACGQWLVAPIGLACPNKSRMPPPASLAPIGLVYHHGEEEGSALVLGIGLRLWQSALCFPSLSFIYKSIVFLLFDSKDSWCSASSSQSSSRVNRLWARRWPELDAYY